ncbi:unnamed protein product [Effrenium voratum]|nr:unnamed protein product [Effrenium voratum]
MGLPTSRCGALKGDGGTKFCALCANVHSFAAKDHEDQEGQYTSTTRYDQLRLVTDQELLDSYQRLDARRATCSKKDFQIWQQATGLTGSKFALLLHPTLRAREVIRPVSQFCHEYMRGVLQGVAPVVVHHTLEAFQTEGFQVWEFLRQAFPHWKQPKATRAGNLEAIFSQKQVQKHKNNQRLSCQASECLAIFGPIRFVIHTIVKPQGMCPGACSAFLAMATLIDQIHGGAQSGATTRSSLLQACEEAIQSYQAAGFGKLIPKWHWLLHMTDILERLGHLPNCFAPERKHKGIGGLAIKLQNTKDFETNLLQQVLAKEIAGLFPETVVFLKSRPATPKELAMLAQFVQGQLQSAKLASCLRLAHGAQVHGGDVVAYGTSQSWQVAQVLFHVELLQEKATMVQVWDHVKKLDQQHATCRVSALQGLIPASTIICPLVFSLRGQGEAKVLLPCQLYSAA